MASRSKTVVGVDFGTTTSLVALGSQGSQVSIEPLGRITPHIPSLVGARPNEGLVAGDAASDLTAADVVRSVKTAITNRSDTLEHWGDPGRRMDADAAIRAVLEEVVARAAERSVSLSSGAVRLGCPAMWKPDQRERLVRLATDAGMSVTVKDLVDEPIAAGIAWVSSELAHGRGVTGRVLVFDMGGGSLDVAVLNVDANPGRAPAIDVLASSSHPVAGDSLDEAIYKSLTARLAEAGVSDTDLHQAHSSIRRTGVEIKETLSDRQTATVDAGTPSLRLPRIKYTRDELEDAFDPQMADAERFVTGVTRESLLTNDPPLGPVESRALTMAELNPEISHVLLVGGMSRIPMVKRRLAELLSGAEVHSPQDIDITQAVAAGLADTDTYERTNLNRPGFDVVLELNSREQITMYEAFSPFYESWEAMQRFILYYERHIPAQELPSSGTGALTLRSLSGKPVTLNLDDGTAATWAGLPVHFGTAGVALRMYPNGRVTVTDGKGKQHAVHIYPWPVLRGTSSAVKAKLITPPPKVPPAWTDTYPHGPRFQTG